MDYKAASIQTPNRRETIHAAKSVRLNSSGGIRDGVGAGLTIVELAVQSIGGSLDKGVLDTTELRVVGIAVDGVGVALLGEEKEFLEQHCVCGICLSCRWLSAILKC